MNVRKGLTRLLIALVLPWELYWGFTFWSSYRTSNFVDEWLRTHQSGHPSELTYLEMGTRAGQDASAAVWFGIVLPVLALVVGLVGYWVYRGFRPNKSNQGE